MSKKFLKNQAEELLNFELKEVKGGVRDLEIADCYSLLSRMCVYMCSRMF